ncbi:hypothetical protein [Dactylosporangium sp. NPDC048998]|uniref:hypothetical protein n=1 Tax=Dactylosporangium sp. NPDC048998 TaxID=3363976 RepID=UPI00371F06C9
MKITIAIVLAVAYGWLTGRIPAPEDPGTFWIGNLAAPYLMIGFLASAWAARKAWSATLTGAAAAAVTVCGFYNIFAVGIDARNKWGLPPSTPESTALRVAYEHWLRLLLFGVRPWLLIGLVTGAVAGYLGYRWVARRDRLGPVLLGVGLIVEPAVYFAKLSPNIGFTEYPYRPVNVAIWLAEALIGAVALVYALRRSRGKTPAVPPDAS